MQQGESTARQRLQLLETHRRRIKSEMSELATALELVEHKIEGYDQLLTRGLKGDPPKRRLAPHRVRIRAAD